MENYFFEMIKTLRKNEDVILYKNILTISEEEQINVGEFLEQEYHLECSNYPFQAPAYDSIAGLWAATFIYLAAQLILYRKNAPSELELLFPKKTFEVTASSILSVDICFRFIPDMLIQLKMIDSEDPLIRILEEELQIWHYSGINHSLKLKDVNFEMLNSNACLQQLYLNRIVTFKNLKLAKIPYLNRLIKANFGIYEIDYWGDFKSIIIDEQH